MPGYYPPIKGRVAGQIGLNLWDPFEFPGGPKNLSEESKARRLQAELQNGRLAMIGIMGFLAASSVPGSVPFLAKIPGYPTYSGNVMVRFSNDFSLFFVQPTSLKSLQNSDPLTPCDATKADLVELQNSLPGPPGYWDPLEWGGNPALLADLGLDTEEANIGWLRHAEIKHGRVAMAAVLGFIAQCTPLVSGEHTYAPYRGYIAGCTPQEQWDNIPLLGKLQIITLVGMLESYGEGAGNDEYVHYTKGGKPGYYPPIKGQAFGQINLNLWDPFSNSPLRGLSEESKARRLKVELQNGRLAMLGIMSFLSASSVPGSVPFLANIEGFPQYSGNVMA